MVQPSIDGTRPRTFHYDRAKRLAPLRDRGVLVVGSGHVAHDLHAYALARHDVAAWDRAARFDTRVRELLLDPNDVG